MNLKARAPESLEVRAVQNIDLSKEKLSGERWQEILRCKEDFLKNRVDDPSRRGCIDSEVVESWLRSRQMGVDPHTIRTTTDRDKLSALRAKHQSLIQTVSALINPVKSVIVSHGYLFYLVDSSGLILLNEGVWTENEALARQSSRSGILADEESEGTTAHALCFRLKRPVQLVGPEHYCSAFQNRIASAAPIMGDGDEAIAGLVIFSPPVRDYDTGSFYLSTLGMVPAFAVAAEMQIRQSQGSTSQSAVRQQIEKLQADLHRAQEEVVSVHKELAASLAFIDEGVVVVDCRGNVLEVNQEAARILQVKSEEICNHSINEFFRDGPTLMKRAHSGESFITEEFIKLGFGRARNHRIHAHPILSQYNNALDVMMLKFVSQKQIGSHQGASAKYTFSGILGESREIKTAIAQAQRYSNSMENILILGESGTGKELFAQSIHNAYRPKGPFMAVNCAALPHELVGSELFGFEGGSFTGADRQGKAGKIELAHGGTLFLDEIGDMSLEHQAILLRTLEDKRVMRIGGSCYKDVDFRLIAATNRDLAEKVRAHTFREDLFYRISVLTLSIPPLRKRAGDIALLSRTFLENYCCKHGCNVPVFSPEFMKLLVEYAWPGNVRQLQNAIHHAINISEGDTLLPGDLPEYILSEIGPAASQPNVLRRGDVANKSLSLKEIEKATIEAALLLHSNCIEAAAESVGLSRSTFYRKMKEYKVVREPIATGGCQTVAG
jgi:transcriptional regulator with PAS, ATPase and Fis domain